jgi:hypothetical protein
MANPITNIKFFSEAVLGKAQHTTQYFLKTISVNGGLVDSS